MEKEENQTKDQDGAQEEDPMTIQDQDMEKEKLTTADPGNIKFTAVSLMDGKNGEAKVDIHLMQTTVGMGKEELMKYANEPFWVRLRMFLFILFWVGWVAMLVGAVVIILVAPRCPPPPKLEWYQKTAMYQVSVKNYKDSNNDGVGDLAGLTSALTYIKNLKVKTILLDAIYSMAPGTNAVINHTAIDPQFGTMTDMETFLSEAKKHDLKVILDFIPNHSSDQHPWFQKSLSGEEPYKNFYVWNNALDGNRPPNNWLSVDSGSAWEWNSKRNQYYLHTFGKNEPDLNLRDENVQEEIKKILQFWLNKGVDGFKIMSASHLVEDLNLRDEPLGTLQRVSNPQYDDLHHIYTIDQPETFDLLADWKALLSNYSATADSDRIFMAEISNKSNVTSQYYMKDSITLVELPMNPKLMTLEDSLSGYDLQVKLDFCNQSSPDFHWPSWVLGDKNTKRLVDRVGDLIDAVHMAFILSCGTPITYFGDEFGLNNSRASGKNIVMPWYNSTSGELEAQYTEQNSHVQIFKKLVELRDQPAINFGEQHYPLVTNSTFSMVRIRKGSPGYLVVVNLSLNSTDVDLVGQNAHLPESARVEIRSRNIDSGPLAEGHPKIKLDAITLGPKQAIVCSFVPKFEG